MPEFRQYDRAPPDFMLKLDRTTTSMHESDESDPNKDQDAPSAPLRQPPMVTRWKHDRSLLVKKERKEWGERRESNPRLPGSQPGALTN